MSASMLEEFELHNLSQPLFHIAGQPIAFTNSALYMLLAVVCSTTLMVLAMRPAALVPGRWQLIAEKLYNLVSDLVTATAGEKARPFFPFIFTIFTFILFCNLLGLIPHSLAVTSHALVNIAIALSLFVVILITGFARHGLHFFHLFVPPGAPAMMIPLLVVIELFSFCVRPFSLAIRLFANMLAGHILLGVFGMMSMGLVAAGSYLLPLSILPLLINIAITGFEFFVAFLQAYIFAILASVYLRDALEMH